MALSRRYGVIVGLVLPRTADEPAQTIAIRQANELLCSFLLQAKPQSPGDRGVMSVQPRETAEKPGRRSDEQHKKPKSDIEISQAAHMRPILEVAKDKLGIDAEDLIPYGHYKATVSLDYTASLRGRPNGNPVLVTPIPP